jgi:tRNA1(Val) A37 N6-methylase TrmN6
MDLDFPTTDDGFLNGRLQILQPKAGFRAGVDSVFLAASIPARAGQRVLELGTGPGVAALCLLARVPGVMVTGLEREAQALALARENLRRNQFQAEIIAADVTKPLPLPPASFAHIFANPPFFDAAAASPSPHRLKARAHAFGADDLAAWVKRAGEQASPGASLTLINTWSQAHAILALMEEEGFGSAHVLPLAPRRGAEPIRAIVQAYKGATNPPIWRDSFILHGETGNKFTPQAELILRNGKGLQLSV